MSSAPYVRYNSGHPSPYIKRYDRMKIKTGSVGGQYEINMPRLRSWNIVDHVIAKEIFTILLFVKLKRVSFKVFTKIIAFGKIKI